MLATDPDADRVGIAVKCKDGSYELLSGNEVGVLLLDYICAGRIEQGTMPKNPVMCKSIVSTPLADKVAEHYGCLLSTSAGDRKVDACQAAAGYSAAAEL